MRGAVDEGEDVSEAVRVAAEETQVACLTYAVPVPEEFPREEGEGEQDPHAGNRKGLQHHQVVVRHAVTQLACGGRDRECVVGFPSGEAGVVGIISLGDGALIGRVVDDVGNEESEYQEEDEHEEQDADVRHHHSLQLAHLDCKDDQLHEG